MVTDLQDPHSTQIATKILLMDHKAAVTNLTKYLAAHAPNFNINCIVPGGVEIIRRL